MTTVTIDDALANRLRTLRGAEDDLNALVAEALAKTADLWEREAQGRAEMQAMLEGPRHTLAEVDARIRQKYGYPDLSHLTKIFLLRLLYGSQSLVPEPPAAS